MEQKIDHPSFGNIQISRVQSCKGQTLFGSGAKHTTYVMIRIGTSNYTRKYSNEWIHPQKTYVEIAMSEAHAAMVINNIGLQAIQQAQTDTDTVGSNDSIRIIH